MLSSAAGSAAQFVQKIAAQHACAASAAGAAGMDILCLVVEYGGSAVHEFTAQGQPFQPGQLQQSVHAHLTQVTGDNPVEVLRAGVQIGKIGIPDSILLKDSKLTDDEYSEIKNHPAMKLAYQMGKNV